MNKKLNLLSVEQIDLIVKQQKELDEKNELICAVTEELSVLKVMTKNHEEELASNRMYSVALLEKYQKKLDEKKTSLRNNISTLGISTFSLRSNRRNWMRKTN